MTDQRSPAPGEFLLYETEDGRTRVECRFVEDSLWLTQSLMADLFQVKVPTIRYYEQIGLMSHADASGRHAGARADGVLNV